MIYAVCNWKTKKKTIIDSLKREINKLLGDARTGCFGVLLKGPMDSDDAIKDARDNIQNALLKLALKEGDVVFVDRNAIDVLQIPRADLGPNHPNTTFFAVDVTPGCTLKDVIRQVDLRTLKQIIAEIENAPQCLGCEKDDRREWTEPSEHTCGRQHRV